MNEELRRKILSKYRRKQLECKPIPELTAANCYSRTLNLLEDKERAILHINKRIKALEARRDELSDSISCLRVKLELEQQTLHDYEREILSIKERELHKTFRLVRDVFKDFIEAHMDEDTQTAIQALVEQMRTGEDSGYIDATNFNQICLIKLEKTGIVEFHPYDESKCKLQKFT